MTENPGAWGKVTEILIKTCKMTSKGINVLVLRGGTVMGSFLLQLATWFQDTNTHFESRPKTL